MFCYPFSRALGSDSLGGIYAEAKLESASRPVSASCRNSGEVFFLKKYQKKRQFKCPCFLSKVQFGISGHQVSVSVINLIYRPNFYLPFHKEIAFEASGFYCLVFCYLVHCRICFLTALWIGILQIIPYLSRKQDVIQ